MQKKHRREKVSKLEIEKVISHCPNWLRPVVEFAYGTGMRLGIIVMLKWCNVDFQKGCICITPEMTMSGKSSEVKLNKSTLRVLEKLSRDKESDYIFCDRKKHSLNLVTVHRAFQRVIKKADLAGIVFYSLRNTARGKRNK